MNGTGWAMGLDGWLWMILVIAACVAVLVALVWMVASAASGRRSSTTDAAHLLKARFARGEISPDDYEQARPPLVVEHVVAIPRTRLGKAPLVRRG